MAWLFPEGPSEGYIPRGGFTLEAGYVSSFDDETKSLPVYVNTLYDVESTWINRAYFAIQRDGGNTKQGDFYVEFLDGAQVVYPNVPIEDWISFIRSGSHGMYVYQMYAVLGQDYETIRTKTHVVTGAMKAKRDIGVKVLDDRPTVRHYLAKKATDRFRSAAYNPQRRR